MKFLLDENLPAYYRTVFNVDNEHKGFHVSEYGLTNTPDDTIRVFAQNNGFTIVTFDLDFSRLAALNNDSKPSILTFRTSKMSEAFLKSFVENHLLELIPHFETGATVTVDDRKIRIKHLPF
jgi:predicted nuclease of predicted toxin-antitoxin system